MLVFNVYEPPQAAGDRLDRAERLAFVKDGFHWMAALFPVIWLPVKGLWIELVVFIVGAGLLTWALEALGVNNELVSMLFLIAQIIIGFEATNIQGAALERRGWRMAGTVTGRSREECEARFLSTWLAGQPDTPYVPGTPSTPERSEQPTSWAGTAWQDIKASFDRGRRLART